MGRLNFLKRLIVGFYLALTLPTVFGLKTGKADSNDPALISVKKLLSGTSVPKEFLTRAFADTSVNIYPEIRLRFENPYEEKPYPEYRKLFITKRRIERGATFFKNNKDLIGAVTDSFGVDPMLLLSISGIESNHGNNHGEFPVFSAFYTIIHTLPNKANWAAKELAEFLLYCYRNKTDPHSLLGSYAIHTACLDLMPVHSDSVSLFPPVLITTLWILTATIFATHLNGRMFLQVSQIIF